MTESIWYESSAGMGPLAPDLVLFPPAGSGPSIFRSFSAEDLGCRIHVASFPGRGRRFSEPPVTAWEELVEALVDGLSAVAGGAVALFGHSMGAVVAFEVARRMPVQPLALFVAGAGAPTPAGSARRRMWSTLTDAEFIKELRGIGGIPDEVAMNAELMEFMMPVLRADFELVDSYRYIGGPMLSCPIFVLGGQDDPTVLPEGLAGWAAHSSGRTEVSVLPGGHFFVQSHWRDVVGLVRGRVRQLVGVGEGA
ncbi:thioesterase II family protein [Actinomyces qiguomingii]|uniref:thioesterase II family protein n=1 Tax=Actinomyces qiguomingii TaxID=2057800 RepID=UPI000CA04E2E|nr:alpha/beta fold hydrolase [Actinomyces qiguomingii]